MSITENDRHETVSFDAIAKAVVAEVLRRLGQGSSHDLLGPLNQASPLEVLWVLGAPTAHLACFNNLWKRLTRMGYRQRFLLCEETSCLLESDLHFIAPKDALVLGSSEPSAGRSSGALTSAMEASKWAGESALVYVASLGITQARRLAATDDVEPFARVLMESLLSGTPVHLFRGEGLGGLQGLDPKNHTGALARQVANLWRDLELLGVQGLRLEDGLRPLTSVEARESALGKTLGGLLTEKDVEEAARSGLNELKLARGTVVTPLARDRARELGVSLTF
mgnify:CR=1 FL=1